MTENVQIALIIAVALVVVVGIAIFVLKDKIQSGQVEATGKKVKGSLKTHSPSEPRVSEIIGAKIKGNKNKVTVSDGGKVRDAEVEGDENEAMKTI
ncbi:MAG: hypothetical protein WBM35_15265 [Candidatus Electrothrix sp.]